MSWNPVVNEIVKLKKITNNILKNSSLLITDMDGETIIEKYINLTLYAEENNTVSYTMLGNTHFYRFMLRYLDFNQLGDYVLIRYKDIHEMYNLSLKDEIEDIWEAYDGFLMECRSIVINIITDDIVLCPFRKFRNLNECKDTSYERVSELIAESLNKNNKIEFSDKLDGSMQSARYYNGNITIAGSKGMDMMKPECWRVRDGYKIITENENYRKLLKDNPDFTFIFEYICLKDAHIVKYAKEQEGMYLIGIRDIHTGREFSYSSTINIGKAYGVKTTKIFNRVTLDEVISQLDNKKSYEAEGFVLNVDGFRVKIKYNDYVNINNILSKSASINAVIKAIADNNFDDIIPKIPEIHRDIFYKIANKVKIYLHNINKEINEYFLSAPRENRKEFMIWVDKNVPMDKRKYVRSLYVGLPINFLKSGPEMSPKYKKAKDLGISLSELE